MGSGKSLVGALVAAGAHARFFDLDHVIEEKAGLSIPEIFATRGEAGFRALEREMLPAVLKPDAVVALGGGAVMDDENWRLIAGRAATVYLEAPFEVVWQRIQRKEGRPLISRRTQPEVEALFERRRARYEQAEHRVDATRDAAAVAREVLKLWSG